MSESQSQNYVTESDIVIDNVIRGTRKIAHSESIDLSQVSSKVKQLKEMNLD